MSNQTGESQIAGVDYATFLGVILAFNGVIGTVALVLTGGLPTQAMGALVGVSAAVCVLGNALIVKGMGYRAVLSSIRRYPGLWLFTAASAAAGGSIMVGTAALLLKATS